MDCANCKTDFEQYRDELRQAIHDCGADAEEINRMLSLVDELSDAHSKELGPLVQTLGEPVL